MQLEVLKENATVGAGVSNNADILRRISNLEKIIYGKE